MYIAYGDWYSSRPMLAVTMNSLSAFESHVLLLLIHLVFAIKDMYGNTSLNLVIVSK